MNEVELIRSQLATERRHAEEVANACASALDDPDAQLFDSQALGHFCQTCVDYLVWVLARFEQRDQVLIDLRDSRPAGEERRRALQEIHGRPGKSREALARLEAAVGRPSGEQPGPAEESVPSSPNLWREFAEFFNRDWSSRRDALDEVFSRAATVAEWRMISAIDADSILDERSRFARVQAAAPPSVQLRA
jgi:hypothetical protein